MPHDPFGNDLSRHIWDSRYRWREGGVPRDGDVCASWRRVAEALATAEPRHRHRWRRRFLALMQDLRFLPGGRILAGAGTGRDVTLLNCFVMGGLEDSMDGIFTSLKEAALTMQQGGGVGVDFSTLRPAGAPAQRVGGIASGPVSFMHIWDAMCATLLSTGSRRGAMMATLRCDHPDIETFIDAKRDPRVLRNFNLSVLVTDAFLTAVRAGAPWPLVFPEDGPGEGAPAAGGRVQRAWSGAGEPVPCRVLREVPARALWQRMLRAAYDTAEPGVLFIDRINRDNNLGYREHISATNPCGEIPLPPHGACDLGSLNLTRFVQRPFSAQASLDLEALGDAAATAVRMLDAVITVSRYPLPAQARQARGARRIGLGITGLADALIMLGLRYDSDAGRAAAAAAMSVICHAAYRASIALAGERGHFPYLDPGPYLEAPFIRALPADIRDGIAERGIRNSHLTAIAPAGTISLLANNCSSGIEPVFALEATRRVRVAGGSVREYRVTDPALTLFRTQHGNAPLPAAFVTAGELRPADHLAMQAALAPFVDGAISKTINLPADCGFDAFASVLDDADRLGLKGCTAFRPNPVTGAVLAAAADGACTAEAGSAEPQAPCCGLEREGD